MTIERMITFDDSNQESFVVIHEDRDTAIKDFKKACKKRGLKFDEDL